MTSRHVYKKSRTIIKMGKNEGFKKLKATVKREKKQTLNRV